MWQAFLCDLWTYSEDNSKRWVSKQVLNKDSICELYELQDGSFEGQSSLGYVHTNLLLNIYTHYFIFIHSMTMTFKSYILKVKKLRVLQLEKGTEHSAAWGHNQLSLFS